MLAFVTGATGFIGLNLVEQLTAAGWNVVALHRQGSDLTYLQRFDVRRVVGDIVDLAAIERAMPEMVDAVFHTAADLSSWSRNNERQTQNNIIGTRNVVAAALKRGAKRFVHTSTSSVYGLVSVPIDETAPQLGRGLKASVGILFEAALNDGFELWRALRAALGQPPGLGVQVMAEHLHQVAAEHGLSGEQEVGDRTDGVQVGACVDGIWISQRLGSHVDSGSSGWAIIDGPPNEDRRSNHPPSPHLGEARRRRHHAGLY